MASNQNQRIKGKALLSQLGGLGIGGNIPELAQFDPVLADYVVEFLFGEILSRQGLDLATRMLCALPPLLVSKDADAVEGTIRAALDAGASREQIVQVVIQTGCFAGFPKWAIGSKAGLKVFRERGLIPPANSEEDKESGVRSSSYDPELWDKTDLWAKGWAKRDEVAGKNTPTAQDELARFDPLLVQYHMEFRYGTISCRPELDIKTRELCRLATFLTTGENFAAESAIEGSLNVGANRQEVVEVIIQTGLLSGINKWTMGARMALKVFRARGLIPADPMPS